MSKRVSFILVLVYLYMYIHINDILLENHYKHMHLYIHDLIVNTLLNQINTYEVACLNFHYDCCVSLLWRSRIGSTTRLYSD